MRPLARSTAVLAVLTLVAGCEKPAEPAPPAAAAEVAYACAGGQTLKASYPDSNTAVVTYGGQTFTLTIAQSASGSRYVGAGREWWIKAYPDREEGTLSPSSSGAAAGGPPIAVCRKAPTPGTGATPPAAQAPAAVTTCRSGDLSLTRVSEDAGAGQRHVVYALTNNAAAACTLKGYVTAAWFDADGAALDGVTVVQSDAQMSSTSGPPSEVALAPKGRAVFYVSYTGIQATDKACVSSKRLRATPPGNTQAIEIDDVVAPCTDRITLGPVRSDPGDANL